MQTIFVIIVTCLLGLIIFFIQRQLKVKKIYKDYIQKQSQLKESCAELLEKEEDLKDTIDIVQSNLVSLLNQNQTLEYKKERLAKETSEKQIELEKATNTLAMTRKTYNEIEQNELIAAKKRLNDAKGIQFATLENEYDKIEKEFDKKIHKFDEDEKLYQEQKDELIAEIKKLQDTYTATIEIAKKSEMVKTQHIILSNQDKTDIDILNSIKDRLRQPRVLNMAMWTGYYKKPMDKLCADILGTKTICGVYKVTNIQTNQCYIGQAVDIAKRFHEHAKCGLGIDAPANNKLYSSMQEFGLESFSWEVLEQCPREQLDEKEKYYITLFKAKDYGYNSTAGNGTNLIPKK